MLYWCLWGNLCHPVTVMNLLGVVMGSWCSFTFLHASVLFHVSSTSIFLALFSCKSEFFIIKNCFSGLRGNLSFPVVVMINALLDSEVLQFPWSFMTELITGSWCSLAFLSVFLVFSFSSTLSFLGVKFVFNNLFWDTPCLGVYFDQLRCFFNFFLLFTSKKRNNNNINNFSMFNFTLVFTSFPEHNYTFVVVFIRDYSNQPIIVKIYTQVVVRYTPKINTPC